MFDARKELLLPGIDQVCSAAPHSASTRRLHTFEFCLPPESIGRQATSARRYRRPRRFASGCTHWDCPTAVLGAHMKALKKGILKRVSNDDVHSQQPPASSVNGGDVFYDAPEVRTAPCKTHSVLCSHAYTHVFRMLCWRRPLQHDRSSLHNCILVANSSGPPLTHNPGLQAMLHEDAHEEGGMGFTNRELLASQRGCVGDDASFGCKMYLTVPVRHCTTV